VFKGLNPRSSWNAVYTNPAPIINTAIYNSYYTQNVRQKPFFHRLNYRATFQRHVYGSSKSLLPFFTSL